MTYLGAGVYLDTDEMVMIQLNGDGKRPSTYDLTEFEMDNFVKEIGNINISVN